MLYVPCSMLVYDVCVRSYPYSTRELVNIVRHLQAYPSESIASVLASILDFDSYDDALMQTLTEIFHKHGTRRVISCYVCRVMLMPCHFMYCHLFVNDHIHLVMS